MRALLSAALTLIAVALAGCTVHQTEAPGLSGPSDLALSIRVTASPDTIIQDGGSQSSIQVSAIGPDGKPKAGLALRMDMNVISTAPPPCTEDTPCVVPQDSGTLSARTLVTNSNGLATVVYTAPPSPTAGIFGTCKHLPGNCVQIVATATGSAFETAAPEAVTLRLVPPGVILPPASNPTAQFTVTPTPVNFNIPASFDASTSCGGALVGGICSSSSAITSYAWTFGDGTSASGKVVNHTFTSSTQTSTTFGVTLTVTNDRGLTASTTQPIVVGPSPVPTGDWVFSPGAPQVNQTVVFNADGMRAAAGHTLVEYNWIFGDGTTKSGRVVSHDFSAPGSYNVTLTVVDEVGQKTTIPHLVTVGVLTGFPFANFTFSPPSPVTPGTTVTFDASASTAANGATIVSYQWSFGDPGSTGSVNTSSPTATHAYTVPGTYTISLTVIDSQGRSSAALTRPIQVQ